MITDDEVVIEDLKELIALIETGQVTVGAYGVHKEVKEVDLGDFDEKRIEYEDTGKRKLSLEYIE